MKAGRAHLAPPASHPLKGFFLADGEIPQGCLFGWKHFERKGERGRPPHVWTERNSNKIKLMLAMGKGDGDIAIALGISLPTLRKHYFSEMKIRESARTALDAERMMLLWEAAQGKNVGALKAIDAALRDIDRAKIERSLRGEAMRHHDGAAEMDEAGMPIRPAKAPKTIKTAIGKKGIRAEDAESAIGADPDLAPPSQPRLM